ncbi:MAG: hypothetical protein IT422_08780 [Pirellulaceae bacterium]|nr:hypothetical protein [Pirellulaceae bacterium]
MNFVDSQNPAIPGTSASVSAKRFLANLNLNFSGCGVTLVIMASLAFAVAIPFRSYFQSEPTSGWAQLPPAEPLTTSTADDVELPESPESITPAAPQLATTGEPISELHELRPDENGELDFDSVREGLESVRVANGQVAYPVAGFDNMLGAPPESPNSDGYWVSPYAPHIAGTPYSHPSGSGFGSQVQPHGSPINNFQSNQRGSSSHGSPTPHFDWPVPIYASPGEPNASPSQLPSSLPELVLKVGAWQLKVQKGDPPNTVDVQAIVNHVPNTDSGTAVLSVKVDANRFYYLVSFSTSENIKAQVSLSRPHGEDRGFDSVKTIRTPLRLSNEGRELIVLLSADEELPEFSKWAKMSLTQLNGLATAVSTPWISFEGTLKPFLDNSNISDSKRQELADKIEALRKTVRATNVTISVLAFPGRQWNMGVQKEGTEESQLPIR